MQWTWFAFHGKHNVFSSTKGRTRDNFGKCIGVVMQSVCQFREILTENGINRFLVL
jgi:hypothetical protein